MKHSLTFPLLAASSLFVSSAAAAAPFAKAPVPDRELAVMVGTGGGLAADMPVLVSTQARFDRSMLASSTSDPIDAWWALVGSELIAGNLL